MLHVRNHTTGTKVPVPIDLPFRLGGPHNALVQSGEWRP